MINFNKKQKVVFTVLASVILGNSAYAGNGNLKIVGTIDGYVLPTSHTLQAANTGHQGKPVTYQHIVLSPEAKQWLAVHADEQEKTPLSIGANPVPATQLGMNDVPVLDQGRHGTCVTFASSAALDAARGHDDYISQLCSLELGTTLEKQDPTHYSGWDGSWGDVVLNQINDYGIINMASQRKDGCAGVYEYPRHDDSNHGNPMSVKSYAKRSEHIMNDIEFVMLATHDDAMSERANVNGTLQKVKQAIRNRHRVVFGTLLDVDAGYNGALGTYKVSHDSWILTPEIRKHAKAGTIEAGHEMVITGYDDNAVIMGPDNTKQVGVLTLRNSWGNDAGDSGNYYMSYAHFKLLSVEAYEIAPKAKQ